MRCLTLCLALVLVLLHQSEPCGADQQFILKVSNKSIKIQVPSGFMEPSETFPQVKINCEKLFTDVGSRLLAIFITQDDLGRLLKNQSLLMRRFIRIEIPKTFEYREMSRDDFKQLKRIVKQDNFIRNRVPAVDVRDLLKQKNDFLDRVLDSQGVAFDQIVPLGIFFEDDTSIGNSLFARFVLRTPDSKSQPLVEIRGGSLVLSGTTCLSIIVTSVFDSKEDIDWVYETSKQLRANIKPSSVVVK